MPKRERPEDGGMLWHPRQNAFECLGCTEMISVRSRHIWMNPERLAEMRELLVLDHDECWKFDDPRMAAHARKYRKDRKRRELLRGRASGAFDRMAAR